MSDAASTKVTIANRLGLHARPAMMFVEVASKFDAEIKVCRTDGGEPVDGKSIMQLMMLAATQGTELEISACGSDHKAALDDLVDLIKSNFSEE